MPLLNEYEVKAQAKLVKGVEALNVLVNDKHELEGSKVIRKPIGFIKVYEGVILFSYDILPT